ncbi:MAG: RcpC/CpaB family pilus assembly protein [Roseiflexaceae bacterium]|nr:RcpC/CpaB family pilus assembly protein [Roseiflexaceae bacterium]
MRGGGRLFLLLGVVIAAAAALLLLFFLQPQTATPDPNAQLPPTAVVRVKVVTARLDLPVNSIITDTQFLASDEITETEFNDQKGEYFTNEADLINKVTVNALVANRPIRKSDVVDGGLSLLIPTAEPDQPRPKAIPFQVNSLTGVADLVTPGDFVDLVVTFRIERFYIRPGLVFDPVTKTYNVTFTEDKFTDSSTKTLAQNVQVLKMIYPRVEPSGTPTAAPAAAPPPQNPDGSAVNAQANVGAVAAGDTLTPGNWVVILAVTDQEAELIRYSLQQSSSMALILRGRGDSDVEQTLGVTLNLLVSQFGLPAPVPFNVPPADVNALTPTPQR